MRKDYIPIAASDTTDDEAAFVEKQWTRVWETRDVPDAAGRAIESRDEYRCIAPYIAQLAPGSRLLDGGCGLGEWTIYFARRGFETVGLDISRPTIERLKSRFPNHDFRVGDIRQTELPDRWFDAYFSWGAFEHFEEGLGPCLREALRILKPDGFLFISVPFLNRRHLRAEARPLWKTDRHFDPAHGYRSPMRFYQWRLTRAELWREFELSDFRTLRVEPIHKLQGVGRMVQHDLGIPRTSLWFRVAVALLYPLIPGSYVAHMILGIAQRRRE